MQTELAGSSWEGLAWPPVLSYLPKRIRTMLLQEAAGFLGKESCDRQVRPL